MVQVVIQPSFGNTAARQHWTDTLDTEVRFADEAYRAALTDEEFAALRKRAWKTVPYLPALAAYLAEARPASVFAASPYINVEAVRARRLAGVPTRLILSERTHVARQEVWRRPSHPDGVHELHSVQ